MTGIVDSPIHSASKGQSQNNGRSFYLSPPTTPPSPSSGANVNNNKLILAHQQPQSVRNSANINTSNNTAVASSMALLISISSDSLTSSVSSNSLLRLGSGLGSLSLTLTSPASNASLKMLSQSLVVGAYGITVANGVGAGSTVMSIHNNPIHPSHSNSHISNNPVLSSSRMQYLSTHLYAGAAHHAHMHNHSMSIANLTNDLSLGGVGEYNSKGLAVLAPRTAMMNKSQSPSPSPCNRSESDLTSDLILGKVSPELLDDIDKRFYGYSGSKDVGLSSSGRHFSHNQSGGGVGRDVRIRFVHMHMPMMDEVNREREMWE